MKVAICVLLSMAVGCGTDRSGLRQPDASAPAAGICVGPRPGSVVDLTITLDNPFPRCLKVRPNQRLRVTDKALLNSRIRVGGLVLRVPKGRSRTMDRPIGDFLAPGVHHLKVEGAPGPVELWVVE